MNFRQLEAFRALMAVGTASRAADLLGITQPAVSRSIIELERSIGIALFDRVMGRMLPTPEGRAFHRDAERTFTEMDRLKTSAARIRDLGSGELRVGSLPSLGARRVPAALHRFHVRHPDVRIAFQVLSSSILRDLVLGGQLDVAIVADEVNCSGLTHQAFASYAACIAVPRGHRLARREFLLPADLDGEVFIAVSHEDTARRKFDAILETAGVQVQIVVETPFSVSVMQLVKEGTGIGLVNPAVAGTTPEKGVVLVPFEPQIYFRKLLVFPPDRQKSTLVRAMVRELMAVR
jgi:DNA-binding transcriptional LysR family regulator